VTDPSHHHRRAPATAHADAGRHGRPTEHHVFDVYRHLDEDVDQSFARRTGVAVKYAVAIGRCRDIMMRMAKQTTIRLPEELAHDAEAVARVKGTSVNALIVESLQAEIDRVRQDEDFTSRARKLLERDKELLDRLAR
jgi:predicted DNA-binding protein